MTSTTAAAIVSNATTLITFAASPDRFAPARLREACDTRDAVALAGLLPDGIGATAALGIAVRTAVEDGHRWVHAGQAKGVSRWIYCAATVTDAEAQISGHHGAEADNATGILKVDAGVPHAVVVALRAAYDTARGVVDPARVNAAVTRLALKSGGQALMPGVVMLPHLDANVQTALRVLSDLGGVGVAHTLGDVEAQHLARPLTRSVEDDVADLVQQIEDLTARAKACASDDKAPAIRDGSAETLHARLAEATAKLERWRDRLGLSFASIEASMALAAEAMDTAVDDAMEALKARRAARRAGDMPSRKAPLPGIGDSFRRDDVAHRLI